MDLSKLREKYDKITADPKEGGNSDFLEKFFQLQMGTNLVRILPWRDESKEFYAETSIHRVPDSKNDLEGQARNLHCLKTIGKKCPICDLYYGLWKTGVEHDKAVARKIKGRERYYLNVLVRETNEVKILSIGKKLFGNIVSKILDPDYGDITDLKKGFDYKIIKDVVKGSNGQDFPNYDKSLPRPKSEPAGTDAQIATYMDQLHDIHELVKHEEYSTLKERIDEFYNGPKVLVQSESSSEISEEETDNSEPLSDKEYLERLKNST